jgi:glutamyl-tRNA synthetase
MQHYESVNSWTAAELETVFKSLATEKSIKPGELMLPLRIMLVGGKFGPGVFDIAEILGKAETLNRIDRLTVQLSNN